MEEEKKEEVLEEETKEEAPESQEPVRQAAEPELEPKESEPEAEPQGAGTPPAPEQEPEPAPAEIQSEATEPKIERTFTQEQVNALVGKARAEGREKGYEQAKKEALERYGVEGDDQLDELFANGSRYGELSSRFEDERGSLLEARTELALVKSGVLPERQGDVKAILGAQGLDITVENIESMLPTHPEWKAAPAAPDAQKQPNPIPQPQEEGSPEGESQLGAAPSPKAVQAESEAKEAKESEEAMKMFGLKK